MYFSIVFKYYLDFRLFLYLLNLVSKLNVLLPLLVCTALFFILMLISNLVSLHVLHSFLFFPLFICQKSVYQLMFV